MHETQGDSPETARLLERVRAGDRAAFEQLFASHQTYLKRVIGLRVDHQLRRRMDVSDLVQETHLEALNRIDAYLMHPSLPFRFWLRQIACDRTLKARRHHLGSARRAMGREVPLPERSSWILASRLLAGSSAPGRYIDQRELGLRLRGAIAGLPETDRDLVMMRHFEGLSNQEAATILGIDPATCSKRHGRAMLRLHRALFENGITESGL
jgi:RNA polymerase sigma-70 factor (ECF subfamily)